MDIILSGTITAILPAETGQSQRTGQPWMSQKFVLCHEQGQYPRNVCFRIFGQDKIQQAAIQLNEYLTVHLNIDAKPSQKNGEYYNTIDCWKVEHQQQYVQQGYQQQGGYQAQPQGYQQQVPQQGYQQVPMQQMPQQQVQQQAFPQPFPQQQQAPAPFPPQQQQMPFPPAQ